MGTGSKDDFIVGLADDVRKDAHMSDPAVAAGPEVTGVRPARTVGGMTAHLVVIAVVDGVELLDVAGPLQVLSTADRLVHRDVPRYETLVAGPVPGPVRCAGGTSIVADVSWTELDREIGTLIVPGGLEAGPGQATALRAESLVDWLAGPSARRAHRIASVCSLAHLLAAAGLLDWRRATSHWASARQLAADHTEVTVEQDSDF